MLVGTLTEDACVFTTGISNHYKTGLPEGCLDLVSAGSGSEVSSNRSGSDGSSTLQHSSLASIPGGYDADISRVFSGNNGTSHQQKLLPGPLQVYALDAITFPVIEVLFHSLGSQDWCHQSGFLL